MISRLPAASLWLETPVEAIGRQDAGWVISSQSRSERFDGVIVATPAPVAARLVRPISGSLGEELLDISYTSSITVTLVYDQAVRTSLPPGFGFLVPSSEGRRILAATFVHNKFPYRAPDDRALVRCFISGSRNEGVLERSDAEILSIAREELQQTIRLGADPLFARIYRWKSVMAQYGVNHLERLERIDRSISQVPALALAGNGYRGIGVPDCIRSGHEAAGKLLAVLGLDHGKPAQPSLRV